MPAPPQMILVLERQFCCSSQWCTKRCKHRRSKHSSFKMWSFLESLYMVLQKMYRKTREEMWELKVSVVLLMTMCIYVVMTKCVICKLRAKCYSRDCIEYKIHFAVSRRKGIFADQSLNTLFSNLLMAKFLLLIYYHILMRSIF